MTTLLCGSRRMTFPVVNVNFFALYFFRIDLFPVSFFKRTYLVTLGFKDNTSFCLSITRTRCPVLFCNDLKEDSAFHNECFFFFFFFFFFLRFSFTTCLYKNPMQKRKGEKGISKSSGQTFEVDCIIFFDILGKTPENS